MARCEDTGARASRSRFSQRAARLILRFPMIRDTRAPMSQRKPAAVTRLHPGSKLFVLDTNVLMHDPTSLFRFQEHDVYLPMATLEELDANKKGMSEVARNARQASRFLDELLSHAGHDIDNGIEL